MASLSRVSIAIAAIVIACADGAGPPQGGGGAGGSAGQAGAAGTSAGAGGAGPAGGGAGAAGAGAAGTGAGDAGKSGAAGNGGAADGGDWRPCAWTQLMPAGPWPAANRGTAVYDAARRRMLVMGTDDDARPVVWSLSLAGQPAWELIAPSRPASTTEFNSRARAMIDGRRLMLANIVTIPEGSLWSLDLESPSEWSVVPVEIRVGSLMISGGSDAVLDAPGRRIILHGGYNYAGVPATTPTQIRLSDAPVLEELATPWTPAPRFGQARTFYDAHRHRVVVYGGSGGPMAQVHVSELSLAEPPTWATLMTGEAPPFFAARSGAAYDAIGPRIVAFAPGEFDNVGNGGGGRGGGFPDGGEDLTARVFTFDLAGSAQWQPLPTTVPGPRWISQEVVYDEGNDRMVLFGGRDWGSSMLGDEVWALDLASCR